MMYGYGYGPGWGWAPGAWIMMIVFWGLLVVGVAALVRVAGARHAASEPPRETALDILKRRYAHGDLTADQFEDMKKRIA